MRFRSLNAQAVGHVHGRACLPWVFELAGKYGIKVIAMEITHDSHLHEIAAVGAFAALFLGPRLGLDALTPARYPLTQAFLLAALVGLMVAGLVLSALHLGKPQRFYRGFNNLRYSPVSREAAGIVVFLGLLGGYAQLTAFPRCSRGCWRTSSRWRA